MTGINFATLVWDC